MRVWSDEEVATLARISGVVIDSDELHEVALRLSVMLDAIERVRDEGIADADADQAGPR